MKRQQLQKHFFANTAAHTQIYLFQKFEKLSLDFNTFN